MIRLLFGDDLVELLLIGSDTVQPADLLLQQLYLAIEIFHQHTPPVNKDTITPTLASVRPQSSALRSAPHLEACILLWESRLGQEQEQLLQWVLRTVTGGASPPWLSTHAQLSAEFLPPSTQTVVQTAGPLGCLC